MYGKDLSSLNKMLYRGLCFLIKFASKEKVSILVNNCGGPPAGPAAGQKNEVWENAFKSMALPMFSITNALLPYILSQKWGRIVTIGSSGIEQPIPNLALSNGIRGAIAGWSKSLANEVACDGITVNMVLPGRVATDRLRELDQGKANRVGQSLEEVEKEAKLSIPAARYGQPEEFASVVTFLSKYFSKAKEKRNSEKIEIKIEGIKVKSEK